MPRYTLEIGHDFENVLCKLARDKDIPKAEVIRRAVSCYAYFDRALKRGEGYKVSITDEENQVLVDVVLP